LIAFYASIPEILVIKKGRKSWNIKKFIK
jgi:hypothetical protein